MRKEPVTTDGPDPRLLNQSARSVDWPAKRSGALDGGAGQAPGPERSGRPKGLNGDAVRGPQAPLDMYADNCRAAALAEDQEGRQIGENEALLVREGRRLIARSDRARMRWALRRESSLERVRACGHVVRRKEGVGLAVDPAAKVGERVAGWRGLVTCASPWACPRCAAVIGQSRADELRQAFDAWVSGGAGRQVLMLTMTAGHRKSADLGDVWDTLQDAWSKVRRRKPMNSWDVGGWVRSVETTRSERNGWHVHFHVLLFVEADQVLPIIDDHPAFVAAWRELLAKRGFKVSDLGQDLRVVNVDDAVNASGYLVKQGRTWSMVEEATLWAVKRGRGESVSPMQILAAWVSSGDADVLDLWHEWERGSHGRRGLIWSQGFRESLGLDAEMSDEETAASVDDGAEAEAASADQGTMEVAGVLGQDWMRINRDEYARFVALLEVAEFAPGESMQEALARNAAELEVPLIMVDEWTQRLEEYALTRMQSRMFDLLMTDEKPQARRAGRSPSRELRTAPLQ